MEQKEQQRVLEMQQQEIQAEAERLKEEKRALALEAEKMQGTKTRQHFLRLMMMHMKETTARNLRIPLKKKTSPNQS